MSALDNPLPTDCGRLWTAPLHNKFAKTLARRIAKQIFTAETFLALFQVQCQT